MNSLLKRIFILLIILVIAFAVVGCSSTGQDTGSGDNSANNNNAAAKEDSVVMLATTTSTYDTGLLDVLEPDFEEKTGYDLQILSKGTGASLALGQNGDVDVLLVHAKDRELQMVEEGYFVNRHDVMYNDFVILGPEDDPAGVKGMKDAAGALKKIADAKSEFASRGDNSGTNMKEISIWEKASVKPEGDWYLSLGQGMGDTLRVANEKGAYTLADRGTFLSMKDKIDLVVLVEGDPIQFNQYGVMSVNPEKHDNVNFEGAEAFNNYMINADAQEAISQFKKYGEQLFVPNAE